MIPLRDNIPTLRFAYVTYALIAVNFLVFFYELSLGDRLDAFINDWGYVPGEVTGAFSAGEFRPGVVLTLLTATFLHGGWFHILGNMLYLHIFGNNVEDSMGPLRFLIFYLLVGMLANFGQIIVSPDSPVPGIGASGAIAGVLGAYLLLFPRAGVLVFIPFFFFFLPLVTMPAVIVLVVWFVLQLWQGSLSVVSGQAGAGGVAFMVHVAGFVLGMGLIMLFRKRTCTQAKPTWL